MSAEPDMLTVGAGTLLAPDVELFTYEPQVTSCCVLLKEPRRERRAWLSERAPAGSERAPERAEVAIHPLANLASHRHNLESFAFTYEPIVIGAGCVLGERSSLMGHSTMQDRAQLMPMAQAMKGMTLLAASRSAGNPADTVRPSDAWWAPLGQDLVPLRQIIIEHSASSASSEA